MRLVVLLYAKEAVAKLTGFSVWWVILLAREGRIPTYSRKPLLFLVDDIIRWVTPINLAKYAEQKLGVFGGLDKPKNPNSRVW